MDNLICDGHLISKNYYNNTFNDLEYLVKYDVSDYVIGDMFYSIIFRLKNNKDIITNLVEYKSDKSSKIYKSDKQIKSKFVSISKGLININGICDNNEIKINKDVLNNYPDNWNLLGKYSINDNQYNLLTGLYNESTILSIDIISKCLIITINNKPIYIPLNINLFEDTWYNLSINLSENGNLRLYKLTDVVEEIYYDEFILKNWKNLNINNYKLLNSDIDIRNIRLFNENILDRDKQLINLISQFSNSSSNLIICDNVDEYETNSYYGSQR